MKSGQLAAQAAIRALSSGTPQSALAAYRADLRSITRAISQARNLRQLMFRPVFRSTFIRGFSRSSTLRQEYLRLLAGETEYADITRAVGRRLPALLWRTLAHTR